MSAWNRLEVVNADFIVPSVDLLHEVRFGIFRGSWRASGPGGSQVLSYRPAADFTLRCPVMGSGALVSPPLSCGSQFLIPHLWNKNIFFYSRSNNPLLLLWHIFRGWWWKLFCEIKLHSLPKTGTVNLLKSSFKFYAWFYAYLFYGLEVKHLHKYYY